jgi:hypothetical protein
MMKRFLVLHGDDAQRDPAFVNALSADEAVELYLRKVYSLDPVFRQYVQDLRNFESFLGQLIWTTVEEKERFMNGERSPNPELITARVDAFFVRDPGLGVSFVEYLSHKDADRLSEAIYEYIAATDSDGIVAIDEALIHSI